MRAAFLGTRGVHVSFATEGAVMKIIITVHLIGIALVCLLIGCATLPKDFDKPTSHAFTETDNTIIGNVRKKKSFTPVSPGFCC